MNNKEEVQVKTAMVAYTDGGARPNPGRAGWGFHGYAYAVDQEIKKPTTISSMTLTNNGYVPTNAIGKEDKSVNPISYVDGYGSFMEDASNNVAELTAATYALTFARDLKIDNVLIKADSEYVLNGLEKWVPQWKKNHWLKRDGTQPANLLQWKKIDGIYNELLAAGTTINVQWVKGHDNIFGNELADELASIGVQISREGEHKVVIENNTGNYWKYDHEIHPFINLPRIYFNTDVKSHKPGQYFLGNHGKDDDLLGKRIPDGSYAVIRITEPEPVIEFTRKRQSDISRGNSFTVIGRLDKLLSSNVHNRITRFGYPVLVQRESHRPDMYFEDSLDEPLTRALITSKISDRAITSLGELSDLLDSFIAKDPTLTITDLTPIIYDTVDKVGKKGTVGKETKLKAEYVVGHRSINVEASYKKQEDIGSAVVTLTLNLDIPDRNTLKRLEKLEPKVSLITWYESVDAFRYATIIETIDGIGIWAGYYSNLRIV